MFVITIEEIELYFNQECFIMQVTGLDNNIPNLGERFKKTSKRCSVAVKWSVGRVALVP